MIPAAGPAGRSAEADRSERLAALAAFLLFLALALWGARYHWVEQAGTAERDGYVRQAEQLRAGELPRDPYRPLLYPLATAAVSVATRDPFTAARLISNLAAATLAWLAFAFGKRLAGPAAGGWAMALAAVNPNLWILGQHVTTDMLFAALGAAAMLAGLTYLDRPGPAPALAAGLALGLAAFTRSNALFLAPPLLGAWWAARPSRGRRAAHLAGGAALSLAVLLPHWALRRAAFGDPFHDENWKNLAWKLHGYPDWSYLDRVPYHGLGELLRADAAAVLRGGWSELVRFAEAGLPQLLGTWPHVLLFLAGAAWALRRPAPARPVGRPPDSALRVPAHLAGGAAAAPNAASPASAPSAGSPRAAAWLLASCAFFIAAVAFTFFTWGRLLLLVLAPAAAFSGVLPGLAARGGPALRRRAWTALGLAAVLLLAVKTFAFRLPAAIREHPYAEIAALRRLDAELPGSALAGTSPFLGRYLRHRYVDLPDAFGAEIRDPRLYYRQLANLVQREKIAFLVIGAIDLRARPRALLGPAPPVDWLRPASEGQALQAPLAGAKSPRIAVWRVITTADAAELANGKRDGMRGGRRD
jgi:hypothetical protein